MNGRGDVPPAETALASPQRRRLLDLLRVAAAPRDAHELAAATGLHVSTVRFHLDLLLRAGLVAGRSQPRATAGRPRIAYTAVSQREPGGYPALTRLLAANLADTPEERAARAERAGMSWATELTAEADQPSGVDAEQAARTVTGMFAELGFDPELAGDETDRQIRLRACPFRDAARANPEVVCSVHLGLLRGALDRLGAPPTTTRLLPFVEPELCLARLIPTG
jgi:predicted ArsR family transcriptional regulator